MTYCCQVIRKKLISYITNPHANGGNLLKDLRTPDFKKYALEVKTPGSVKAQDMKELGNYILGMAIGVLPQMLGMQLTAFLQLEQQQKRTYVGIGLMTLVNAALDYVFIVVLRMGMFGLGLSTSISYWTFFLVLGSY